MIDLSINKEHYVYLTDKLKEFVIKIDSII